MKQTILYLPVVHAGYEEFLTRHADSDEILVLGRGFAEVFPKLGKDIRALDPERAARHARVIVPGTEVRVLERPVSPAVPSAPIWWSCRTRRSCICSPRARTSPTGPSSASSRRSCAGTGSGAARGSPPGSTSGSRGRRWTGGSWPGRCARPGAARTGGGRWARSPRGTGRCSGSRTTITTPPSTRPTSTAIRATSSAGGCGRICPRPSTPRRPWWRARRARA